MLPDQKAQILDRLSFEGFYTRELQNLKPTSGDNVQALCPFHDDKNPSLSINLKTGLYKCFACDAAGDVFSFYMRRHGCDFKEALAALGQQAGVEVQTAGEDTGATGFESLRLKEFALKKRLPEDFLKQEGVTENRFPDGVVATDFHYLDQAGKLSAIRHRFANRGDKKFRWRKGDQVGLYGLWKLAQIAAAGWCLLVEGETDALTCWLHGLPALGIPGKKTWSRAKVSLGQAGLEILRGLQVYLWEEPDAGVRSPKNPLQRLLRDEVFEDLPNLLVIPAPAGYKDLSEAHCQRQEIKTVVADLKRRARPPEPPPLAGEGITLSDLGNARRLVARDGKDLRYNYLAKKWYFWDGRHWRVDDCGEVERRSKGVVADIYQEAADCGHLKRREALGRHALASEASNRLMAMVRQAQSEPGIPVLPKEFDADPWLFNCANGAIDLRSGDLRPHDRADLMRCMSPVVYAPDAPCPTWDKFLYKILADNIEVYDFVQRALGYALTGNCREECLFMLWGGGANGKSTLVNTVGWLLGTYACNTPVETLLSKTRGNEIPTDVARLDGPRFVMTSEVDHGRRLAESLVKAITGRDTITARFLYGEYFDFTPKFKLFLSTNNKPVIKGADDAIWRRIMFLKFPVQIPKAERDLELADKLKAEGPGILAWLVRGCLSWQKLGLDPPAEVLEATAEYRAEMDVLHGFLQDRCLLGVDLWVTVGELYEAYQAWAEEQGMKDKEVLKARTFGIYLAERGFLADKSGGGVRIRRGLTLKPS